MLMRFERRKSETRMGCGNDAMVLLLIAMVVIVFMVLELHCD